MVIMVASMRRMMGTNILISSAFSSQARPSQISSTTLVAVKRLYLFSRYSSPLTNIPSLAMESNSSHLDEDVFQGGFATVQGLYIFGLKDFKEGGGFDFIHAEFLCYHISVFPIFHLDGALAVLEFEIAG